MMIVQQNTYPENEAEETHLTFITIKNNKYITNWGAFNISDCRYTVQEKIESGILMGFTWSEVYENDSTIKS